MVRPISEEMRQRCIRLRVDHDMLTREIIEQTGIGRKTAYEILKAYPRYSKHISWSPAHERILIEHYPSMNREDLEERLKGHSWESIIRRAGDLKIRRLPESLRHPKYRPHPLMARLRGIREGRKMTRPILSKLCGYHENQILSWELGKTQPRLVHIEDVAKALGYNLELFPIQEPVPETTNL